MEMLASFEERLAELRRLWDEHRAAEAKLNEKEVDLAKREAEYAAQRDRFDRVVQEAEQNRAQVEQREQHLRAASEQALERIAALEDEHARSEALRVEAEERATIATQQFGAAQARAAAMEAEKQALADRELGLRETAQRVAEIEREANEAKAEADLAAETAREELAAAIKQRDEMAARLKKLDDELQKTDQAAAQLQSEVDQAHEREKAHDKASQDSARELNKRLEDLTAQLKARAADLETTQAKLAEKDKAVAAQEKASQNAARDLNKRVEELAGQLKARSAELETAQTKLSDKDKAGAAHDKATQESTRALQKQIEALTAQVKSQASEIESAQSKLTEKDKAGAAHDKATQDSARSLQKQIETLTAQLKTQAGELEAAHAELSAKDHAKAAQDKAASTKRGEADRQIADLKKEVAAHETRLTESKAEIERLNGELKNAQAQHHQHKGSASKESAKLADELKAAQATIAEREAKLKGATGEAEALKARIASLVHQAEQHQTELDARGSEEIAALRSELERTKAELSIAVESCDRAHADLKKAQAKVARQGPVGPFVPAFARDAGRLDLRKLRLGRAKSLQREQSNKIRAASDALRKRLEQCEQVIGLRVELAQARQNLEQAHKRVQKQRGVSRVAAVLLSLVVMVAMLGALSWVVAGQIWPGMYVATATIKAEARGRELLPEERAEWQRYHEELVADPRFVDKAAEHLSKRGIASLGEPGLLSEYMRANLTHRSPGPGELSLELKDEGAERTARILDTIVVALAYEANAARSKRIDGGTSDIDQNATPSESPIDDTRLKHAGMLWGGSVVAFSILGVIGWGRLAAAKLRYEGQSQVEHVLQEDRWPDIPGLGPKGPTGSPLPSTAGRH